MDEMSESLMRLPVDLEGVVEEDLEEEAEMVVMEVVVVEDHTHALVLDPEADLPADRPEDLAAIRLENLAAVLHRNPDQPLLRRPPAGNLDPTPNRGQDRAPTPQRNERNQQVISQDLIASQDTRGPNY